MTGGAWNAKTNSDLVENCRLGQTDFWLPHDSFDIRVFFEGLVLESFNLSLLGYQEFYFLYIVSIICSFFTKKCDLILMAVIGPVIAWALTLGLAEVLWYYLLTWFHIDISYR